MGVAFGLRGSAGRAPGRTQTIIVTAVTVAAIAALSWLATNGPDDGVTSVSVAGAAGVQPPAVGRPPTGFTGLTYDGKTISLSSFAGTAVWLNFGASWCRDCRTEAADLEATFEEHKSQGLVVLAIFINDAPADIAAYAARAGLTFPIIADSTSRIAGAYWIVGLPTHVFVGRDGLIRQIRIGSLPKSAMEEAVAGILP